ncbi:MAG: acylphosphatase [Candidatus Andersenbacteria bacterium]
MADNFSTLQELQVKITGKVQGVFFRQTIKAWAVELHLQGFVRNEPDGSVVVCAQGERSALETLLKRCYDGPGSARVDQVQSNWHRASTPYSSFTMY